MIGDKRIAAECLNARFLHEFGDVPSINKSTACRFSQHN
jgi:hypothetical protein